VIADFAGKPGHKVTLERAVLLTVLHRLFVSLLQTGLGTFSRFQDQTSENLLELKSDPELPL